MEICSIDHADFARKKATQNFLITYEDHQHLYGIDLLDFTNFNEVWLQCLPSRVAKEISVLFPHDFSFDFVRIVADSKIAEERLLVRSTNDENEDHKVPSRKGTESTTKSSSYVPDLILDGTDSPTKLTSKLQDFIDERLGQCRY